MSANSIKPQESPSSNLDASKTPSPTTTPTKTDVLSSESQKNVSVVQLQDASQSQQSLPNKSPNQSRSGEAAEASKLAAPSLLELSGPNQKPKPIISQQASSINPMEAPASPGPGTNNGSQNTIQPRESFQATQPGNRGVYQPQQQPQPPWCFPFALQCQPVPPGMFCCTMAPPMGNSAQQNNSRTRGNPYGPPDMMGMKDNARSMNPNQFPGSENAAEDVNLQRSSGPLELPNNWMQNPNGNPTQYPSQNVPPIGNQPFFMQCSCPSSYPYPVNLVCSPWQGAAQQRDYPSNGADAGFQLPNCPQDASMGMYQNGMQQPQLNQYGAQNNYNGPMGNLPPGNMNNGCNPAGSSLQCCPYNPTAGSSMPCSPFPSNFSRNSMPGTCMCPPQFENQQSCILPCGLTSDNGCLNQFNNQCDQEQDCQKPRQITLVREVYHFKKIPRKCSTKHCCPAPSNTSCRPPWCQSTKSRCNQGIVAVAPFRNEMCSPQCPTSRMDVSASKYSSCFSPWKSNHKLCSNGKMICVRPKRPGECVCMGKPRGCVGPTALIREFYVRGQKSCRGSRRFLRDDDNNSMPDAMLAASPDMETGLDISNAGQAGPNAYFNGSQRKPSRRTSKPRDQQEELYEVVQQDRNEDENGPSPSVPFAKKP